MDLDDRLMEAIDAAERGDHEHALREFIWFHDHSLEVDDAYYGVRLSYALSAWADLAGVYAPAKEALVTTRDSKARRLLDGAGDPATFHDVEAINRHPRPRDTYDLFLQLCIKQPDLARACRRYVWELVGQFGDPWQARECIDDPEHELTVSADILNACAAQLPASEPERESILRPISATGAARARLLLHVLAVTGDAALADKLRSSFVASLQDATLRRLVTQHLAAAA